MRGGEHPLTTEARAKVEKAQAAVAQAVAAMEAQGASSEAIVEVIELLLTSVADRIDSTGAERYRTRRAAAGGAATKRRTAARYAAILDADDRLAARHPGKRVLFELIRRELPSLAPSDHEIRTARKSRK
jgi:hypothetical protein